MRHNLASLIPDSLSLSLLPAQSFIFSSYCATRNDLLLRIYPSNLNRISESALPLLQPITLTLISPSFLSSFPYFSPYNFKNDNQLNIPLLT